MDAFRQPKFSYYMFCSQRPAEENKELIADSGPMVYIANEMTPFSPKDVTVYSNCEEVRLTFCKNGTQHIYHTPIDKAGMPSPVRCCRPAAPLKYYFGRMTRRRV